MDKYLDAVTSYIIHKHYNDIQLVRKYSCSILLGAILALARCWIGVFEVFGKSYPAWLQRRYPMISFST